MRLNDHNSIRRILGNTASYMIGRLFVSLFRFFIIFIIIRESGVEMAGNYGVIFGLIILFENIVDFGMTHVVVRNMCQNPEHSLDQINRLIRAKKILALLSSAILLGTVYLLNYPIELLKASFVATLGLMLFSGILVFRAIFRVKLMMGHDVLAELIGVIISIPFFWLAATRDIGLSALIGCYVLSRLIYLLLGFTWSRKQISDINESSTTQSIHTQGLFSISWPLGVASALGGLYLAIDPVLISILHGATETGLFFGSMRFIVFIGVLVQAFSDTLYSVLASYWKTSREDFNFIMNMGFRAAAFLGGGGLIVIFVMSGFLVVLMGAEMAQAESILRILSFDILLLSLSAYLGPLVIVSGGIRYAIILICIPIVTKVVLLFVLVPDLGAIGAAYSSIISEVVNIIMLSIASYFLIRKNLDWLAVAQVGFVLILSIAIIYQLDLLDTIVGGVLAIVLYLLLGYVFRVIPAGYIQKLLQLLKTRSSTVKLNS